MSSEKKYLSLPLSQFVQDLGDKTPAPGGGSAAAVVGALSASLGRMTVNYTVGRKRFAGHEPRLRELLGEFARASDMFGQLMSEDMAAYERYAAAGKAGDREETQRALAVAIAVPMEMVVLAGALAARYDEIKAFVNPNLYSDLRVGALLADACARSAAASVRVNLLELGDAREVQRLDNQLDLLLGRAERHRVAVVAFEPPAAG